MLLSSSPTANTTPTPIEPLEPPKRPEKIVTTFRHVKNVIKRERAVLTKEQLQRIHAEVKAEISVDESESKRTRAALLSAKIQAASAQLIETRTLVADEKASLKKRFDEIITAERQSLTREEKLKQDKPNLAAFEFILSLDNFIKFEETEVRSLFEEAIEGLSSLQTMDDVKWYSDDITTTLNVTGKVRKDDNFQFHHECKGQFLTMPNINSDNEGETDQSEIDETIATSSDLLTGSQKIFDFLSHRSDFARSDGEVVSPLTAHSDHLVSKALDEAVLHSLSRVETNREKIQLEREEQRKNARALLLRRLEELEEEVEKNGDKCVQFDDLEVMLSEGIKALSLGDDVRVVLSEILQQKLGTSENIVLHPPPQQSVKGETSPSTWPHKGSLRSLVDRPILFKMLGGVDYAADAIAGYNDIVDQVIDFVAGEEGEGGSVGNSVGDVLLNALGSIKMPSAVEKNKKEAGILLEQV